MYFVDLFHCKNSQEFTNFQIFKDNENNCVYYVNFPNLGNVQKSQYKLKYSWMIARVPDAWKKETVYHD